MRLTLGMTRKAKIGLGILGVFIAFGVYYNEEIRAAVGLAKLWTREKSEPVVYTADREGNLKAIRTAMMLYHDTEDQFPLAAGWMDAIIPRLRTNDLKEGEQLKKLHRPGFSDDKFGYAINSAFSGKYKGDIRADGVLVFESQATIKNAKGDPKKDGAGLGITLGGKIVTVGP